MFKNQTAFHDYLLIATVLTLLYGLFLGVRPLTPPDEARYAEIPREMVVHHDYVTPTLNGIKYFEKPALFYWLQALSIKFFGLHEWSLRLMNALMGILGCVLLYGGCRRLYDRSTAILSSCILASSVLYSGMSQFVTLDMTVTAFLTGGLLSFICAVQSTCSERERRNLFWSMYIFFALATLTKGLIGVILPGMVIFSWLLTTGQWQQLRKAYLLTGSILFLLISVPWHVLVQLKNPEFFHFYFIEQQFLRYFTDYAHREQAIWFLPSVLLLGFFPWVVFLFAALKFNFPGWRNYKNYKNEIFFLLWFSVVFFFYWKSHSQLAPYILPVFPALAILTSRYLLNRWQAKVNPLYGYIIIVCTSWALLLGLVLTLWLGSTLNVTHPFYLGLELALSSVLFTLALLCNYRKVIYYGLPFLVLGSMTLVTAFNTNYQDERSIKPLIAYMQSSPSKPLVISYRGYYQDLPFYLQREVALIHFKGELEFGMQHQNVQNIMLDEAKLWNLWQSPQRIFMLLKQHDYNSLLEAKKITANCVIAKTKRNVLISNQDIKL